MTLPPALRAVVVAQLDAIKKAQNVVTAEEIRDLVLKTAGFLSVDVETAATALESLARDLESNFNIVVGSWNSLSDDSDHVAWLSQEKPNIEWRFWERYERYLRDEMQLPLAAVERTDEITQDILGRLENPARPGAWDRRGLVAGQVQSGKTSNYTGLVAKALDSGYKLVVILAGVHNSLRSQTQYRIDEGILGFDTRHGLKSGDNDARIGVGKLAGNWLHVNSFTSSRGNGDFNLSVATNLGVAVGGHDPIVLVIKKNSSILKNLHEWATKLKHETDPVTGRKVVRDVPVLVIDDEADHASVDTNGPRRGQDPEDVSPTRINGLIRTFLDTFEQSAYVAYTATPYANIFISPDATHEETGEDLFPRSFIVNLPAASTYVGPAQVFGLAADAALGLDERDPLPIVRTLDDYAPWLPDGHKSDEKPGDGLPESLREAILNFLMGVAIRKLRGHANKHHSMLIHVTRFKITQAAVHDRVEDEVEDIVQRLTYGEGSNPELAARARRLYDEDFVPTSREMEDELVATELLGTLPTYEEVWEELQKSAVATRTFLVNGDSSDALEYVDHPEGLTVIAIGGDKLSRGLTLEGLSVSYYLRASRMYDTLMQMGRWFGYRPGYLDTCRLYTTSQLQGWYRAITSATEELQSEFDAMAATGRSPKDFGLRVRQHPDGLMVTSPTKLRHAIALSISYSGTMAETVTFQTKDVSANWAALEDLVTALGDSDNALGSLRVWKKRDPDLVREFLSNYRADPTALKTRPDILIKYIESRLNDGELISWTIALADAQSTDDERNPLFPVGPMSVRLTHREAMVTDSNRHAIRRVVSPRHELVSLMPGSTAWDIALEHTICAWEQSTRPKKSREEPSIPSGLESRRVRNPGEGLLILYPLNPRSAKVENQGKPFVGFALSFPHSDLALPVEYKVNSVFWDQEFGYEESDSEDDE